MKYTTPTILALIAPFAAHAATTCPQKKVDFEEFEGGDWVTNEMEDEYGLTINAVGRKKEGMPNFDTSYTPGGAARIFDTSFPGTEEKGDPDLGSPNQNCTTINGYPDWGKDLVARPWETKPGTGTGGLPGKEYENCTPLFKVLVIQEFDDTPGIDQMKTVPDDNSRGGTIIFKFNTPMHFDTIKIFDIDDRKPVTLTITQFSGATEVVTTPRRIDADGGIVPMKLDKDNVESLTVDFVSSGAISELTYSPMSCDDPPFTEESENAATEPPVATPAPTPIITTGTKTVGSGGDPHIKKWDGSRYYYHGECDLVLVKNPTFNKGEGFEIHIRTKIEASYSFIENVAVRVGDSILEVGMKTILIDGKEYGTNNLPVTLKEGYTVEKPYFQPRMKGKFIDVELNNGDFLKITVYKEFISVDVSGLLYDFEHSVGMIGNFHTSQLLGRDGETVYSSKNVNSFGLEWQVTAEDPQLFHETRAPIHPQQCRLPEKKTKSSRKLRGINEDPRKLKAAEDACAHKSPQDFSFCVTDVMVTDDIHMANAW